MLQFAILITLCLIILPLFAFLWLRTRNPSVDSRIKTLIVLGSGGHTAEMLPYAQCLSDRYSPRIYAIATTDSMSEEKLRVMERSKNGEYVVKRIPRAREVKQSYFTSIFTTIRSTIYAIWLVFQTRPRLVLCNGPGTCIPVCFASIMARILLMRPIVLVFVESVCRTRTLSLTGKILYYSRCADVIVQWPQLHAAYPGTVYLGLLS